MMPELNFIELKLTCRCCGADKALRVSEEGYRRWKAGAPIQSALRTLSAADLELLVSQVCEACFDKLFPPDEAA